MEEEARKEKEDEEWARRVEEKKERDTRERERNRAKRARKKGKQGKERRKGKEEEGRMESDGERSGSGPTNGIERGEKEKNKKTNNGRALGLEIPRRRADGNEDPDDEGAAHWNGAADPPQNKPRQEEEQNGAEIGVIIHDDD